MNKTKRILSYFIAVVMTLSLLSPQVFAQDNDGSTGQSYNEESFFKVFTDREFGMQVLRSLGVNPENTDWSQVNDYNLSNLSSIYLYDDISSLDGIEKLSGLESIFITNTKIVKFPDNIEKKLTNLKSFSIGNNLYPITIPAFATLTELSIPLGQAINLESKEAIESMVNLKTLNLSRTNIDDNLSVAKIIDYSKFKELEELDISRNNIGYLPEGIKRIKDLKCLNIGNNNINEITEGFFENLNKIETLGLGNCKLSVIPDEVFALSNLKELDISYNNITNLTSNSNVLASCEKLNLNGNRINEFSGEFFNSFPSLKSLSLMFCGFGEIPESISNLEGLLSLNLGSNPIEDNSSSFCVLSNLSNLEILDLTYCGLNEIPESVLSLSKLRSLRLSNNAIKNIPGGENGIKKLVNLNELSIGACQLEGFPQAICDLTNLNTLNLYNNNISKFPNSRDIQGRFSNLESINMGRCNLTEFPDMEIFPDLVHMELDNNLIYTVPNDIDLRKIEIGYINLSNNYFTSVPKPFLQASNNLNINLAMNYIKEDSSLPERISISMNNQLLFSDIPKTVIPGESIDVYKFLSRERDIYTKIPNNISEIKDIVPVEFTVLWNGIKEEGRIDEEGKLTIFKEGKYEIIARLKDADESNSYAKAVASVEVISSNGAYNEEKFKSTFPDEAFRIKVLKALNQFHLNTDGSPNYNAIQWDMITDNTLAQIKSLGMFSSEISDLKGLEKLTGLENLQLCNSRISGFPEEVEKKLVNLKTLKLADNTNKITIPKFANLNELVCGDLSGQAIVSAQNISKESIDSINSMKSLTRLELNNTRDIEVGVNLAEIVDYSMLESLKHLSLACNEFEELPKGISALNKLLSMDLSSNNLKNLPDYFGTSFNNLVELSLKNCKFESIPEAITNIPTLYSLEMQKNNIKEIPMGKGLSRLKGLKNLYLYECGLTSFPEGVLELENLEFLNLSGNSIKSLPIGMGAMKNLNMLMLSNCQFDKFPDEILDIEFLERVSFNDNIRLKSVPGGENGIGKLKHLVYIDLNNCGLMEFPDFSSNYNLHSINLENNNILEVPENFDLSQTKVQFVELINNNIAKIPEIIINEAKNHVRSYNFSSNYLYFEDKTIYNHLWIASRKELAFKPDMPQGIKASETVDLNNYIVYKIGNEIKGNNGLDNAVEYSYVDSQGNFYTLENGMLSIDKPGTYTVKGIIKGADSTNLNAVATRVLHVADEANQTPTTPTPTTTPSPTQASQAPVPSVQSTAQASPTPTPTPAAVTMPVDDKGVPAVNPNGLIITADKNKTIVEIKASEDYIAKMIKNKVCEIDLIKEINTISSTVNIPQSFIKSLDLKGVSDIRLITPFIIIGFSIKEFVSKDISKLSINLGKRSDLSLTKEQKSIIGPSEVVQIAFEIENADGKKTELKKTKSPMSIKLPYESEGKNDRLTLYSLGTDGKIENLAAKYDETLKTVTAKTKTIAPVSVVNNSIEYNDVKKGNWAQNYIEAMSVKGIVKGYENGIFKPDLNITRAEFASIITRLLKLEANGQSTFKDIKDGDWYKDAVMAAAEANIITGWKGKFMPNDRITREDAAVMISRALAYVKGLSEDHAGELMFSDKKKISLYAEEHIRFVVGKKIMSGKADNYFDPKGYTTRAEVAKMVYMLFEQM